MKKISVVMTAIFGLLTICNGQAQVPTEANASVVTPYHLAVTYFKTTNLVYPFAIKSVDRGSRDVLAQKAKGVENVLQVKAAKQGIDETNLSVITADGKLYSYILNYADNPSILNVSYSGKHIIQGDALMMAEVPANEAVIRGNAARVATENKSTVRIKDKSHGMKLVLTNVFIQGEVMYYQFNISNRSNVSYGIDQFRFAIRDQQKAKRTANQEAELQPLYVFNDLRLIPANATRRYVVALPKYTLPDQKYLFIQMMEKDGGRHLSMKVRNKTLEDATVLK